MINDCLQMPPKITCQGAVLRLGGLRWGPELHGAGHRAEAELLQRDVDLCLSFAEVLEVLHMRLRRQHVHAIDFFAVGRGCGHGSLLMAGA